jgi:hypothetical protein
VCSSDLTRERRACTDYKPTVDAKVAALVSYYSAERPKQVKKAYDAGDGRTFEANMGGFMHCIVDNWLLEEEEEGKRTKTRLSDAQKRAVETGCAWWAEFVDSIRERRACTDYKPTVDVKVAALVSYYSTERPKKVKKAYDAGDGRAFEANMGGFMRDIVGNWLLEEEGKRTNTRLSDAQKRAVETGCAWWAEYVDSTRERCACTDYKPTVDAKVTALVSYYSTERPKNVKKAYDAGDGRTFEANMGGFMHCIVDNWLLEEGKRTRTRLSDAQKRAVETGCAWWAEFVDSTRERRAQAPCRKRTRYSLL